MQQQRPGALSQTAPVQGNALNGPAPQQSLAQVPQAGLVDGVAVKNNAQQPVVGADYAGGEANVRR